MIVITGSESFIGKELVLQLEKRNKEFIGLDSINKSSDYNFFQVDIRSKEIFNIIPENADTIIHLAAISRDNECKENLHGCFDVNVIGTINLINAAKKKNVKQIIFASSEWVYEGIKNNDMVDEETIIDISKNKSEYALTKFVSECNLKQSFDKGFCNVTILRFGIIYGPRMNNWSAVEKICSMIKNNDVIKVGSIKNGRRFIHVLDIVDGIIKSIGISGFNIINLSGDRIITINELINESQKIFKKSVKVIELEPDNVSIRNPSNLKAKKIIKWQPKIGLAEGILTLKKYV